MNDQIQVIGNISSIIDYNLNEQYSNVKKIIISGEEIISSFEDVGANDVFEKLSNSTIESYASNLRSAIDSGILDSTISNQLYKEITEKLSSISDTMMDIQLQGYNFMNSVSNSKFNITLRCESYTISRQYEERGSFLSIIRSLVLDYLEFFGNTQRLKRLKNFQIEIYESFDIHKHIFLKKDGSKLILASNFGFSKKSPIDFISGSEFYFSTGEGFNFFRNSQNMAILREHNSLNESPIQTRDKILSDEELIKINDATKHISDAVIELVLTRKSKLHILNVAVIENNITTGTDNGFYINKSSKNYNRISLVTQRDDLTEEMPNPKYLLLRNPNEIKNFLNDTKCLNFIDGIVLTENFYAPILDYYGELNDIDIIFHKNELNKSLDIELNSSEVLIGNKTQSAKANPFNNILVDKNKQRDEHLERLKQVDLSTPQHIAQNNKMEQQSINHIAESLMSSPNASINSNPNSYSTPMPQSTPGKKMTAIDMLMHAAEHKLSAPTQTVPVTAATAAVAATQAPAYVAPVIVPLPQSTPGKKLSAIDMLMHAAENKPVAPPQQPIQQQAPAPMPTPEPVQQYNQPITQAYAEPQVQAPEPVQENIDLVYSESKYNPEPPVQEQEQEQTGMVDHFAMYEEPKEETESQPQEQNFEQNNEQTQIHDNNFNNYQSENLSNEQNVHNEMINREMVEGVADEMIVENFQEQNPQTFDSEIPEDLNEDLEEMETSQESNYKQNNSQYTQVPQTLKVDIERYNDIISTKLITLPKIESNSYFVDSSNLGEITTQGELFYLTPTDEDLNNDNLNYVIPMGVSEVYSQKHNYIINSANDYFLLEENQKLNLFINLSYIDDSIKETFLNKCLKHAKNAYVVCQKQDIKLIENSINKITGVFVKDLESTDELYSIETSVLTYEKNYLLKHFNK